MPQDYGLIDIYDARVDGGFPSPDPLNVPCEGEACQGPLTAPFDLTPASSIYNGPGNVKPKKKRCPKGKRKVRRNGKVRCVKNKKKGQKKSAKKNRAGVGAKGDPR